MIVLKILIICTSSIHIWPFGKVSTLCPIYCRKSKRNSYVPWIWQTRIGNNNMPSNWMLQGHKSISMHGYFKCIIFIYTITVLFKLSKCIDCTFTSDIRSLTEYNFLLWCYKQYIVLKLPGCHQFCIKYVFLSLNFFFVYIFVAV